VKVLLVNRDDAERNLGGDTIQLRKTQAALSALGVTALACPASQVDAAPTVDLAHVFNLQTADESWSAFQKLRARGIPVVLSSIYWDMLEHWFDLARATHPVWSAASQVLGWSLGCRLYLARQRAKWPSAPVWQRQRLLLEHARLVLPNSRSEGRLLRDTFRLPVTFLERIRVVPNGVDAGLFDPPPAPSRWFQERYDVRDFVLQVGTISPVKNQLGLIEALDDLPVPIVLVGQPAAQLPQYATRVRARGAQRGRVVLVDRLPHEELPGLYALAAVHVLPSWRETPGLVSLEAAASGCRVVTTTIGSARDYFGNLAHYCHPARRRSIRTAVEAALARPVASALRRRVLTEFTWNRAGAVTLDAYVAALAKGPATIEPTTVHVAN
jgi:glycosyltransferase involved in cell wall biosynthesis